MQLSRKPFSGESIESFRMVLQGFAVLASGLFAGVALYVALIARASWLRSVRSDVAVALRDFRFVFPRVIVLQGFLLVLGTFCSIVWWLKSGATAFLAGGALLGAVAPVTAFFVTPVYRRLLNPAMEAQPAEAERQLLRWAWLHVARTALGLGAFGLLVTSLVYR